MLSRVADQLYWFARYVRRTENTARLVGVGSLLQLDLPRPVRFGWRPMIATVGADELFEQCHPQGDDAAVLEFLLLDPRNPSSLRASVECAREILRGVRDALPQEVWEAVNDLHLYIDADGGRLSIDYHLGLDPAKLVPRITVRVVPVTNMPMLLPGAPAPAFPSRLSSTSLTWIFLVKSEN